MCICQNLLCNVFELDTFVIAIQGVSNAVEVVRNVCARKTKDNNVRRNKCIKNLLTKHKGFKISTAVSEILPKHHYIDMMTVALSDQRNTA